MTINEVVSVISVILVIIIVAILVIVVLIYVVYYFDGLESQRYAPSYDTVKLAHRCDDGYTYYLDIQLPEGINISDMHNYDYQFIDVVRPGKTEILDVIPKKNILAGESYYLSKKSVEYNFVKDIRYQKIKETSREFNSDALCPHDVLIRTSH